MKYFKIGSFKTDITPPVGYLLAGHTARNKPSIKIHDPLYLKCVSISNEKETVFIITSDLIGFSPEFIKSVKNEIYKKLKINPSKILITASHTHTGPIMEDAYYYSEKPLPDYISLLKKKIVGGIIQCLNDKEDGIIKFGKGRVNIGIVNRRKKTEDGIKMMPDFNGPIDDEVSVIKFERKDGSPKVIFFNYTCHPTTLSTDIYEISADYPGVAEREIENYYKGSIGMFSNGCCGDVRPAIIENGKFKGGSFNDIEKMGKILFSKVIEICEKAEIIESSDIISLLKNFKFPLEKSLIPENERKLYEVCKFYREKLKINLSEKWIEFMKEKLRKKEKFKDYVKGDLHFIKIGDIFILGLPGEVMVEIGLKLKEKNKNLIVCGYSNGLIGYIPTENGLKEGGYEATSFMYYLYPSIFSYDMEKKLIDASFKLLKNGT